jgi:hypothetical protein
MKTVNALSKAQKQTSRGPSTRSARVESLHAFPDSLRAQPRVAFALPAADRRSLDDTADPTGASLLAAECGGWPTRGQLERVAREDGALGGQLAREEQ